MYIGIIVGCLVAQDPQPKDCTAFVGTGFHNTVEGCEAQALNSGIPFLYSQGLYPTEIKCVPTDVFGVGDV